MHTIFFSISVEQFASFTFNCIALFAVMMHTYIYGIIADFTIWYIINYLAITLFIYSSDLIDWLTIKMPAIKSAAATKSIIEMVT